MVQEYFIKNSGSKDSNLNFKCFLDPHELKNKINQALPKEYSKWEELNTNNGNYSCQCFHKSREADLKIEIIKPNDSKLYIFMLTILGGTEPLKEIAELCKKNSWSAYNTKSLDYLDLNNIPFTSVSEIDKQQYYDEYWEKFNELQQEQEQAKIDLEEEQENRSYTENSSQAKFYKTSFGKVIFEEISDNKELLSLKKLIYFPYDDFHKLKKDINNGTSKVLSFYKYKLLKGINKDNKSMLYHDVTIFMPNLIVLISVVLAILLKDWTFLVILPIKFVIGKLTTNSNDKPYLKYLAYIILIGAVCLYYQNFINISIITFLTGALLSSVLLARNQFNTAITNLALINEEIFCYLIITDHIWLKTKKDIYSYNAVKRANDMIEKWEVEGKL